LSATGNWLSAIGRQQGTGDPKDVAKDVGKIHGFWRASLLLLGAGLISIGLAWWAAPKEQTAFAPQATSKEETAQISEPSETLSGLLIGLGVVSILVGINGRKLTSIKAGDVEVAFAEAASKTAAAKAKKKAKDQRMDPRATELAASLAGNEAFVRARVAPHELDLDQIAEGATATAKSLA
jgi:hypothetical protein